MTISKFIFVARWFLGLCRSLSFVVLKK